MNTRATTLRRQIAGIEAVLYAASADRLSRDERFDLSMRLGIARQDFARALKIRAWSADAALETPDEE